MAKKPAKAKMGKPIKSPGGKSIAKPRKPAPFGGASGPWAHIQQGLSQSTLGGTAPLGSGPSPAGPPVATPEDRRITSGYNDAVATAGVLRDNSNFDLSYDVKKGASGLGFAYNAGDPYDPTRAATAGVDPNNPFSKMALLQRSYEQQKSGTTNEYAASGQLYSGAFGAQKKENQFQNDAANQSLRDAFQELLEQARRGQRDNGLGYTSAVNEAGRTALNQSLGN